MQRALSCGAASDFPVSIFDFLSRYSWHMPRRGAPQAHGPGSVECVGDGLDTANTDSSFDTRVLEHFLQVAELEEEATIFSNFVPHSRHSNSKIGISILPRAAYAPNITNPRNVINHLILSEKCSLNWRNVAGVYQSRISRGCGRCGPRRRSFKKCLTGSA